MPSGRDVGGGVRFSTVCRNEEATAASGFDRVLEIQAAPMPATAKTTHHVHFTTSR
jgi:hypothetical protein